MPERPKTPKTPVDKTRVHKTPVDKRVSGDANRSVHALQPQQTTPHTSHSTAEASLDKAGLDPTSLEPASPCVMSGKMRVSFDTGPAFLTGLTALYGALTPKRGA